MPVDEHGPASEARLHEVMNLRKFRGGGSLEVGLEELVQLGIPAQAALGERKGSRSVVLEKLCKNPGLLTLLPLQRGFGDFALSGLSLELLRRWLKSIIDVGDDTETAARK